MCRAHSNTILFEVVANSRPFSNIFDIGSLMWNGFTVVFLWRAQPRALLIAIFIVVTAWIFFSQYIVTRFLNLIPHMWNTILNTIRALFPKILANRSFKPLTTTIDYWKVLYTPNARLILCQDGQATCLNTSRRDKKEGHIRLRGWMNLHNISAK